MLCCDVSRVLVEARVSLRLLTYERGTGQDPIREKLSKKQMFLFIMKKTELGGSGVFETGGTELPCVVCGAA